MDYSLLLGIEYKKIKYEVESPEYDRFRVLAKPVIANYAFGIIDFLQKFDQLKSCEACLKGICENKDKLSSVPPSPYQIRFMERIQGYFNDDSKERVRFATFDDTASEELIAKASRTK